MNSIEKAILSRIFAKLRLVDYIIEERNAATMRNKPPRLPEGAVNNAFDRDEG